MKKHLIKYLFLVTISISFYNCQRDDICPADAPTTPQLIIRFLDSQNPLEFRQVTNLRVFEEGSESFIINRVTTDSIAIPLRSFAEGTTFTMITDSADNADGNETGNIDIIRFNYNTQEVFISRACGFVANYQELNNALTPDADNWINSVNILTPNVENINTAHVQIFH
ncbi:hypothetical protein GTQ40_17590 [Flavobacteriaceae bacterium R38]|nr:hypothetical protein [Flavobacteriaceae bacterium R38]